MEKKLDHSKLRVSDGAKGAIFYGDVLVGQVYYGDALGGRTVPVADDGDEAVQAELDRWWPAYWAAKEAQRLNEKAENERRQRTAKLIRIEKRRRALGWVEEE